MQALSMRSVLVACILLYIAVAVLGGPLKTNYQQYLENPVVDRFRRYIQIDTSNETNLEYAVEFLREQANELELPISVYRPAGAPIVVITKVGSDPTLPSMLLNSHMDVVYANKAEWSHPPYAAYMDENGNIFGRGTQDTKDVGMQYLEALRRFKEDNIVLKRTLHVSFMPDEETGGYKGMKTFIHTDEFKHLNIGFALDEGFSSANETMFAFYVDRRPWQMEFMIQGEGGHGLRMPDDTAMEKVQRFINIVMEYREKMKKIMKSVDPLDFGAYDSININIVKGGYAENIIPGSFNLTVDWRLSTEAKITDVENMVTSWMNEAGNGTGLSFIRREDLSEKTIVDQSNPYWVAFEEAITEMGMDVIPLVCPATSDMLNLRNIGIPALGFSPKTYTISRIHGKDEYLNVETYLNGIEVYYKLLLKLGNMSDTEDESHFL